MSLMVGSKAKYVVCLNRHESKAIGHSTTCGCVNRMGTASRGATGRFGPFESREEAEAAAKLTGKPFRWCRICGGFVR
jgi:hypothetical protein